VRYYEYEESKPDKIPYDKEPIIRQTNYKKPKVSSGKPNKLLTFVVCVLVIFNIIMAGVVINRLNDKENNVNNTTINLNSTTNADIASVSSKTKLSVVCVHAGLTNESTDNPDYQGFFNLSSKGAGVIFEDNKNSGDAYIVTCYHVIRGNTSSIYILLYDSFVPIKVSMIFYSSVYDIAVLKISGSQEYMRSSATPASIADSSLLLEGDGAVAIGNPLGTGIGVTSGLISKTVDLVDVDGVIHRVVRTDAAINGGNSGGGLFNLNGELIGIVNAKATDKPSANSYIDNVAYAIPSNVAISLAYNIVRNTMPAKAVLGISMLAHSSGITFDIVDGKYIPVQSVVVSEVDAGSAGQKAGLKINDKITGFAYGDTVVNVINLYSFDDHAFNIAKGDEIILFIVRDGKEMTLTLTVSEVVSADNEDWYRS